MIVFTPIFESKSKEQIPYPKYDGVKMSLEEFLNFRSEEVGFKYEWNDGVLEGIDNMKSDERRIYRNINRKFIQTKAFQNGYELIAEADCYLKSLKKLRRPDISIFKKEQIENPESAQEAPECIIEILSPSNSIIEEESKIKEFFQAGSKIVWHIYPSIQEIKIYYSPKKIKVCTDNDICDAGDVIPDFQILVREIFE